MFLPLESIFWIIEKNKLQISFLGLLVNHGSNKVQSAAVFKRRGRFKSPKHKNFKQKAVYLIHLYRFRLKVYTVINIVIYWGFAYRDRIDIKILILPISSILTRKRKVRVVIKRRESIRNKLIIVAATAVNLCWFKA